MNYKITFGSQKDSKNAQQLLFTMGYEWVTSKKRIINTDIIYFDSEMELSIVPSADLGGESAYKNITLEELRAMASTEKEYINKTTGEYRKTSEVVSGEQWIEVPKGATAYTEGGGFYKGGGKYIHLGDNKWDCWGDGYLSTVLWQRPIQPEAPQLVDDEPSLNAEIEKVRQTTIADTLAARQATYGSFEDVACVTQDLLAILKRTGLDSLPKPHKEALHMICSKMARIVNGDHNHSDSWHDIGGYAKLIEDLID